MLTFRKGLRHMRIFRKLFAGVLLASLLVAPALTPALAVSGDVTDILGVQPYFPNGIFQGGYNAIQEYVTDSTSTTPAAVGKLLAYSPTAGTWAQNTTAALPYEPFYGYGIVTVAATAQGGTATIQAQGIVNALCTTGNAAIAKGSFLVSDASGNLTTPVTLAAPSSGSATPFGTTGSTTVTYNLYARNAVGLDSSSSGSVTTSTANATLSATNGIHVAATIPAGTTQVVVVRTVGGASQGIIGIVNVPTSGSTAVDFYDFGQAGQGSYAAPSTPVFGSNAILAISLGTLAASTGTATSVPVWVI